MRRRRLLLALVLLLSGQSVVAQDQQRVDYGQSSLSFVLQSGGNSITGTFSSWWVDLVLPADDANNARIRVEVDVASAETGNPLVNSVLHTRDWLDSDLYPTSQFTSQLLEVDELDGFRVEGQVSIKGIAHPLTLTIRHNEPTATSHGATYLVEGLLDRFAFNIGTSFDAAIASKRVRIVGHIVLAP